MENNDAKGNLPARICRQHQLALMVMKDVHSRYANKGGGSPKHMFLLSQMHANTGTMIKSAIET